MIENEFDFFKGKKTKKDFCRFEKFALGYFVFALFFALGVWAQVALKFLGVTE